MAARGQITGDRTSLPAGFYMVTNAELTESHYSLLGCEKGGVSDGRVVSS
jgi:hypothetical protein